MEIKHIACRIFLLRVTQGIGAPVRGLLLFGDFDANEFGTQILQPMPVGVGAAELGGDFRAIDRALDRADRLCQRGQIETCEMKQLGYRGVCQDRRKIGCRLKGMRHFDQMRVTIAG